MLEIDGVVNAHPVVGRYDIIAYVEADSTPELMAMLDKGIRNVKELKKTDTRLVLMESPKEKANRDRTGQHPIGTQG
jgi:DNA-binding Lrp family transcriptional regulator